MEKLDPPSPKSLRASRAGTPRPDPESLVEASFARIAPQATELSARFYQRLFENYPAVRSMFPDDLTEQRKKLVATLALAIANVRRPEILLPKLHELGAKHASYGVVDAHFDAVGETLVAVLREFEGDWFTAATEGAWGAIYTTVATAMKAGLAQQRAQSQGESMATSNGAGLQTKGNGAHDPSRNGTGKHAEPTSEMVEIDAQELEDLKGQIAAIGKSQAVVEFDLDGNVLTANSNFLNTVGYRLDEIQGRHHSMFVDPEYRATSEYKQFWADLGAGRYQAAQYKRFGKHGKEVWIQASYNPIFDTGGRVVKVVKYATDTTKAKEMELAAAKLRSMVESSPNPMMLCDLNFTITYGNAHAIKALQALEQYLPIRANQIVGSSIDVFHKVPSHQRRILGDPRNLPHTAMIKLGPETLELKVYATYDQGGAYAGPALAWDIVTERVKKADQERALMAQVEQVANKLSTSSNTLTEVSTLLASGATETSAQATRVASAATQIKGNVSSVASAAEEMSSTVREIAGNASESAKTARQARDLAAATNTTVQALSASSAAIGKVTKVISTIAQQTNLLALNATIEAARAGEAGKGFAVVANEVKELAKETARATEEIAQQIETIQRDTAKSVTAIAEVAKVIEQIDAFATSIAASVEEQAATVREIARNANEVSMGVASVVENIDGVAQAAKEGEKHAALTQTTAGGIAEMNTALVAMFRR